MLDLSHNKLNDSSAYRKLDNVTDAFGIDFITLPHLQELYLQHNSFTRLPLYAEFYVQADETHRIESIDSDVTQTCILY